MKYKLSHKELNVMQTLWASGKALSSTDFLQYNPALNPNTVQAALRTLLHKSYIRVTGMEQHNKVFARTYLPCFTETEYMMEQLRESSIKTDAFFAALVEEEDMNTLDELEKIIARQKEILKNNSQPSNIQKKN